MTTNANNNSKNLAALLDQGLLWRTATPALSSPNGAAPSEAVPAPTALPPQRQKHSPQFLAHFGLPEIDNSLPCTGLPAGCLHQWSLTDALTSREKHRWHAPLFLLSALLGRALGTLPYAHNPISQGKSIIVWVGKRCWPTPQLLEQNIAWQSEVVSGGEICWPWKARSVFVDPPSKDARLWSAAQALKNPSVFAVVADCSGFDLNAMRRLQLAAEFGQTLGLMVRPPWEEQLPSAAHTKWRVSPLPSENRHLMWNLELLLAKGVATMPHQLSKRLSEVLERKKSNRAVRSNAVPELIGSRSTLSGSVCSSEAAMKNQTQWFIEWNEESNHGKGSLCFAPQSGKTSSTSEESEGLFSKTA